MTTISQALANALLHHQAGQLQAAEQIYTQILAVAPNHPDALHLLGVMASQTGQHPLAVELITRAIESNGSEATFHSHLGDAFKAQGNLDKAIASYRLALELRPDYAEAHCNLGNVLLDQGKLDESVACFRRALELKPDLAAAHYNLGNAFKDLGKLDAAVASYGRALELRPELHEAHNNLGTALQTQGKLDEAIACFRRALELKPDDIEAHNNLAAAFQAQGNLDEAVACFSRALQLQPNNAELHNSLGTALKAQEKFDDALACFRQALALNPNYAVAQNNLGTVFQAQGKLDEAVAAYRRALALKPNHAEVHSNLGTALKDQGKLDEAVASCRRAIELQPDFAEAHNNLGTALHKQGMLREAFAAFRRALELKPDFAKAHNNLGNTFLAAEEFDEAIGSYRRALELKPDFVEADNNLANAFRQLGRFDEALAGFTRALEIKPEYAHAHFDRSMLRLLLGDFRRGWPEYEWRWKANQLPEPIFPQPRWDGSPLGNRTIFLHAEQGLGDTILFVRYAALVKQQNAGATVIVGCRPALAKLLATCPSIDRLIVDGEDLPAFHVHSPLLSLPALLQTTVETIPANVPYLFADPALVTQWRERLSDVGGLRVGINWQIQAIQGELRKRRIPLECFLALAQLKGVNLISLQKGEGRDELLRTGEGLPILDLGPDFDTVHGSFMDTAAIMKNLDLVISSDTSIPHLAGALGVPVWLALPFVPDWRWLLDRSDSPWYPTMRLFRQKRPGDWKSVFEEIRNALSETMLSA